MLNIDQAKEKAVKKLFEIEAKSNIRLVILEGQALAFK